MCNYKVCNKRCRFCVQTLVEFWKGILKLSLKALILDIYFFILFSYLVPDHWFDSKKSVEATNSEKK